MYTRFGEFMRIKRIKHHEMMSDIAEVLDVSVPFLSTVENGKKNVPAKWFTIISEHYALNDDEQAELKDAIDSSKTQIKLDLSDSSPYQRKAALQFARSFRKIDENTAKRILELLNMKGDLYV